MEAKGTTAATATGLLRDLSEQPTSGCSDAEVATGIQELETVIRLAQSAQLRLIAEADQRQLSSREAPRNTKAWLQKLLNIADADASARLAVATQLAPNPESDSETQVAELPAVADAVAGGAISLEHARVITAAIAKLPATVTTTQRHETEAVLVQQARVAELRHVRILGEQLRHQAGSAAGNPAVLPEIARIFWQNRQAAHSCRKPPTKPAPDASPQRAIPATPGQTRVGGSGRQQRYPTRGP